MRCIALLILLFPAPSFGQFIDSNLDEFEKYSLTGYDRLAALRDTEARATRWTNSTHSLCQRERVFWARENPAAYQIAPDETRFVMQCRLLPLWYVATAGEQLSTLPNGDSAGLLFEPELPAAEWRWLMIYQTTADELIAEPATHDVARFYIQQQAPGIDWLLAVVALPDGSYLHTLAVPQCAPPLTACESIEPTTGQVMAIEPTAYGGGWRVETR